MSAPRTSSSSSAAPCAAGVAPPPLSPKRSPSPPPPSLRTAACTGAAATLCCSFAHFCATGSNSSNAPKEMRLSLVLAGFGSRVSRQVKGSGAFGASLVGPTKGSKLPSASAALLSPPVLPAAPGNPPKGSAAALCPDACTGGALWNPSQSSSAKVSPAVVFVSAMDADDVGTAGVFAASDALCMPLVATFSQWRSRRSLPSD
mmetsp:Transcript_105685/g.298936  ORF Transcript_105685/g.298936 Transcript_105685/m.298936 type:complete len:203 (+) Transcript_105685:1555-2163(+)